MRRTAAVVATALGLIAAPAAAAAECDEPGRPLWGTPRLDGTRVLMRLDRRTLRPLRGSQIRLPRGIGWWDASFSPDCRRLAIAGRRRGEIVIVNLETARIAARLRIGGRLAPYGIEWPVANRLIAFSGSYLAPRFVTVSIPDGQVVGVHTERAQWFATQGTALGVVALGAPTRRVGAARLLLARPDGSALRVTLDRVPAGTERLRRRPGWARRQFLPGLAVDEATARAYVVAAHRQLVAVVDLTSGAVTYHPFASGSGRASAAKGVLRGAYREASWLGNGMLAVSGEDRRDPTLVRPFGLRLVDTATWSTRILNPLLRWYVRAGPVLLGSDVLPAPPRRSRRATGLVAYTLDGRRLFTRFQGDERVGLWGAVWPYAHLTIRGRRRKLVVDLRSGRTVRVFPGTTWPFPLLD